MAVFFSQSAHSQNAGAAIVGTFGFELGTPDNNVAIKLDCENESHCSFITISQIGNADPDHHKDVLNRVTQVEDVNTLTALNNALKYAVDQRTKSINNEEYAQVIKILSPVLSKHPQVTKCWDLKYPQEKYMFACTLSDSNPTDAKPPLYLFTALLATCNGGFCGHVIWPLTRSK